MRKKRILICNPHNPFIYGGAEIHMEALQKQLKIRGYLVDLVQMPFKDYPKANLIKYSMMWRMLDMEDFWGERVDLVIAAKFPSYAVKHSNKVVWLIHQHRPIYDLYGTPFSDFDDRIAEHKRVREAVTNLDKVTLGEAKRIFTNSQNTADRLEKFNGLKGEALYHPPMHYGRYYRGEFSDYILSVGRLEKIKRVDLLIKALPHTPAQIRCLIAGIGPEMESLQKMACDLGVSHRVEFLGFVSDQDLLALYANCMGVFFAPYDEDYGYITLEAFLSHKPVITAIDSGGSLEFVRDGANGFICPLDERSFGQAIERLYANKAQAAEFGQVGYEQVAGITWDHVIDQLTTTI